MEAGELLERLGSSVIDNQDISNAIAAGITATCTVHGDQSPETQVMEQLTTALPEATEVRQKDDLAILPPSSTPEPEM